MSESPLATISSLLTRESRLICGLMSGTSVDAVDVAIVKISGAGEQTAATILHYSETPYTEEIQEMVFAASRVASSNVSDICILHSALAHVYADAVIQAFNEAGLDRDQLDLIGMHGQTVHHLPQTVRVGSWDIQSTLQLGSAPTLAHLLGVPVVSDFRSADIAAGGQGAPLVPYVDFLLFRSNDIGRILLNIGGIANLTWLPAGCETGHVKAYDTGPGNILVDELMRKYYGREFDDSGTTAGTGMINEDLLSWLLGHEYFRRKAPKSTGRETFGSNFAVSIQQMAQDLGISSTADIVATVSELTVRSISAEILSLMGDERGFEIMISGGGAKNTFIVERLLNRFPRSRQVRFEDLGLDPDAKEALAFAILANEWLAGNPSNLPSVTGASESVILGSFSP